jgi:hypothetical protein
MVGGVVLRGIGGVSALVGVMYVGIGSSVGECHTSPSGSRTCLGKTFTTAGWVMLVGGGVALGSGIPLTLHGAERVPQTGVVALAIGPGSVGLRGVW